LEGEDSRKRRRKFGTGDVLPGFAVGMKKRFLPREREGREAKGLKH